MMNFILDFNIVSFGFFPLALVIICAYISNVVKNLIIKQGLAYLGLFSLFIFFLYVYLAIALYNTSHKQILKEEISKEYNVWINPIAPDTLGFLLCEKSDYQSQICKEYISYFISEKVSYEQEVQKEIAKKQEMREIEQEKEKEKKMNIRNRIVDIIKTTGEKR